MKPDEYERGLAELERLLSATRDRLGRASTRIEAIRGRLGDGKTQPGTSVGANGTPTQKAAQAEVVSK